MKAIKLKIPVKMPSGLSPITPVTITPITRPRVEYFNALMQAMAQGIPQKPKPMIKPARDVRVACKSLVENNDDEPFESTIP